MARYYFVFGLIFVATFLLVVPMHANQRADFEILAKTLLSGGDGGVLFGNSVIRTPSRCDVDRRSITEMLSQPRAMVDASRGGMKVGTMLSLIENAIMLGANPQFVVLPLNASDGYYQDAITRGSFESFLALNFPSLSTANISTNRHPVPQSLDGRHFGDYSTFSRREFLIEKSVMKCPENIGFDIPFVRFMYYRNFLVNSDVTLNTVAFIDRISKLESKGLKVLVLLMPMNYEDIESLHGATAIRKLRKDVENVRHELSGLDVLDLSFSVTASGFADRWCACGHLNQQGRNLVAQMLDGNEVVKKQAPAR